MATSEQKIAREKSRRLRDSGGYVGLVSRDMEEKVVDANSARSTDMAKKIVKEKRAVHELLVGEGVTPGQTISVTDEKGTSYTIVVGEFNSSDGTYSVKGGPKKMGRITATRLYRWIHGGSNLIQEEQ